MQAIDPLAPDSRVRLAGVLDAVRTEQGARLRRLPAWTRDQILDPTLEYMATVASGMRIELTSDTTSIELDTLLTFMPLDDEPLRPAVFELAINGAITDQASVTDGRVLRVNRATRTTEVTRGRPATIRFDGLAPTMKRIEVWLSHTTTFELRAMRIDDGAQIEPAPEPARRWVHYGSSISQSGEADVPTGVWPVVAARLAGVDVQSLGFAEQCHLDQCVARTIRDLPAVAISLKLGINVINLDSMRERAFLPAVQGFLDTIRDGHPTTPIVVITPIICPVAENHPGPTVAVAGQPIRVLERPPALALGSLTLERTREILREVVAIRQKHGDTNLHLLEGQELFGEADLADLPDGIHPNAAGYRRMGERFHAAAFTNGGPFTKV